MKSIKKAIITAFTVAVAFTGLFVATTTNASANSHSSYGVLKNVAYKQLGKKYVYGASGPANFDCSGFTQYTYQKSMGITIPRTAQQQYDAFPKVSYKHIQKGDLVFFGSSKRNIHHVGIYIGGGKMIDSQNFGVITEKVKAPWWHYVGAVKVTQMA